MSVKARVSVEAGDAEPGKINASASSSEPLSTVAASGASEAADNHAGHEAADHNEQGVQAQQDSRHNGGEGDERSGDNRRDRS